MAEWTAFGWQGLSANVPSEWELVGIPKHHDPEEGYLRLDDSVQPRLELKWKAHSQRKFDIDKTLDEYLSSIKKTYAKANGAIEIRRDQVLIPYSGPHAAFHENREVIFFSWQGEFKAFGLIWRCELCRRVLMAQVIGARGEGGLRQTALDVFHSLQDHPEGETSLWTAYGLEMEIPRRFRLDKLQLLNGYILFAFTDGSQRLVVERYGLAHQLLTGRTMEEWFRAAYRKSLRGTYFVIEPDPEDPNGLRLDGRDARLIDQIDRWDVGVSRGWDTLFRRVRTSAILWHDPSANRIYVVRATGKERPWAIAERVAGSIRGPKRGANSEAA